MKYHEIQYNSLGAVDSLNTQHCVLLKHSINSATNTESIKCLRSTQYAIASVSNPFASMTLESNPLRPKQFVSQSLGCKRIGLWDTNCFGRNGLDSNVMDANGSDTLAIAYCMLLRHCIDSVCVGELM